MSLWDKLKDAITTDDAEAAEEARREAGAAQVAADKAKVEAQARADEADRKAEEKAQKAIDNQRSSREEAGSPSGGPRGAPGGVPGGAPGGAPGGPQDAAAGEDYTVKAGDTLSGIGQRFGVDWREIARINDVDNPDMIFAGQKFTIPQKRSDPGVS